jgi:hypothetical protein
VQSAVLAEQVLPPLRLVQTAWRTNSLKARVNAQQYIQSEMSTRELEKVFAVIG